MECPGLMGKEEKKVRKENLVKKESEEKLVHLERRDNHPMMSLLRALLVLQVLPVPQDLLVLRGLPEQGTTEPTFRLLIPWGCYTQFQMMRPHL